MRFLEAWVRPPAAAPSTSPSLIRSQEQVRALQEVNRFRRDLLATVSHELRTPLGTILAESTAQLTNSQGSAEVERRLGRGCLFFVEME
ncbi:MAG: histidine kinase dimerization/phospho-acceptor domain-containing protein [Candidatus Dormibacteraceae bacterium]